MYKKLIAPFIIAVVAISGCSLLKMLVPAPIEDGSYLEYKLSQAQYKDKARITFKEVKTGYYEVLVDDPGGILGCWYVPPNEKDNKIIVSKYMKRRSGAMLEVGQIGPIWVPISEREKGGKYSVDFTFSATTYDEVKQWKTWKVYAVTASIFRGAIEGTWYFDTKTGFLVRSQLKTVIASFFGGAPYLELVDTNIKGLM